MKDKNKIAIRWFEKLSRFSPWVAFISIVYLLVESDFLTGLFFCLMFTAYLLVMFVAWVGAMEALYRRGREQ